MNLKPAKFLLPLLLCGLLFFSQTESIFSQTADINAPDETGLTMLMIAAQDGTDTEIKKLLKKGADPEVKDQYGWTALMHATVSNTWIYPENKPSAGRLKALLDGRANVNVSDLRGITPLIIAAAEGKTEFVRLLLAKGADVSVRDKKGATALSYAKAKEHREIANLLEKAGGTGTVIAKDQIPERISPIEILPKQLNRLQARPSYTDLARMNGITGIVRFRVLIGADGTIKKAKLISGLPFGLTEQAIEALKKLKVEAGINDGKPVDYWLPIQYSFMIY
jgi:TonB family protein